MKMKKGVMVVFATLLPPVLALACVAGCGGGEPEKDRMEAASQAAMSFLDALGNQDLEGVRSMLSRDYLEENQVPDPLDRDRLTAALGYLVSYRFSPRDDLALEGDRAVVRVEVEVTGRGTREETLVLIWEDEAWKVNSFTALDWSSKPRDKGDEKTEVEQALRDFLVACIDGRTDYLFEHLSRDYREKHRLEKAWTAAEFSGIFGTARSYDFDPGDIKLEDGSAEVDVTIEFGSRGNLESETSRVRLVKEGRDWRVDAFPFFIY